MCFSSHSNINRDTYLHINMQLYKILLMFSSMVTLTQALKIFVKNFYMCPK